MLLMLLLCLQPAYASVVSGAIYNSELELQKDVKLEINTEPRQAFISKDGHYSFNVPKGEYTLNALYFESNEAVMEADEELSVVDDGQYTLDIILFDVLEQGAVEDIDIGLSGLEEQDNMPLYLAAGFLAVLAIAVVLALRFVKKKTKEAQTAVESHLAGGPDESLQKIVAIIKAEGGRTTQLEIRKHFPLSEAKVSLMIAELEDKKIIRKIKKGRGNIIILNS